jgi:hypothetical protein
MGFNTMKTTQKIFESYKNSLLEISINNTNLSGLFFCRHSANNAIRRQQKNVIKLQFLKTCLAHIEGRIYEIKKQAWIKSLVNYSPEKYGHWANYTAGFNLSLNGKIWLSDNKDIEINEHKKQGIMCPNHQDLIVGEGTNKTIFSGLYSYKPNVNPSIILYSECESVLNNAMKLALLSLVDVHNITINTVVYSNMTKEKLFTLSDL